MNKTELSLVQCSKRGAFGEDIEFATAVMVCQKNYTKFDIVCHRIRGMGLSVRIDLTISVMIYLIILLIIAPQQVLKKDWLNWYNIIVISTLW